MNKYLKKIALVLLCAFGALSMAAWVTRDATKEEVALENVRFLRTRTYNVAKTPSTQMLVAVSRQTTPLKLPSNGYLSNGTLDNAGKALFKLSFHTPEVTAPPRRTDGTRPDGLQRAVILRVGFDGEESQTLQIPDLGEVNWHDFALLPDGSMVLSYEMTTARGALLIVDPAGRLTKQIDTGEFIPFSLGLDSEGSIWAVGPYARGLSNPRARMIRSTTQIRQYSRDGQLLKIPIEGHRDPDDANRGSFAVLGEGMSFFAPLERTVYTFADRRPTAESYSLAADMSTSPPARALLGATKIGDSVLWYGVKGPHLSRRFAESFAYCTALDRKILIEEQELTSKFGVIAGGALDGRLLFIRNKELSKIQFAIRPLAPVIASGRDRTVRDQASSR